MAEPEHSAAARPRIQSVARAADVLLAVAKSPAGLTTKEIADALGLSRPGTYHMLHTLTASELLHRTAENRYVMGLRVGTLATAFGRQLAAAEHLAPRVRHLARTTGETTYAAGWQNGEIVVLTVAQSTAPVQARQVVPGTAEDGHARASGKLLLAFASDDERDDYLTRHPLRARTPNTITDPRRFAEELAAIRAQGYAMEQEEFAEGLGCLAVPLDGGASPFVFGVSAPADRFARERERYLQAALEDAGRTSLGAA
jgi:IclR family transcriptional regulator, acetate operon repressor